MLSTLVLAAVFAVAPPPFVSVRPSAASVSPSPPPTAAAEKAVEDALQAACEAFRTGDVAFLEDFLASGFTLTDTRGNVTSREATLAEVKAREPRYDVFRNHDMKVRLYGPDTAVVTGITTVAGTAGGTPFAADLQFTDTLIRRGGRWRIAASHVSPARKDAP